VYKTYLLNATLAGLDYRFGWWDWILTFNSEHACCEGKRGNDYFPRMVGAKLSMSQE